MRQPAYTLIPSNQQYIPHFSALQLWVRDIDEDPADVLPILARVRSGDYFMTLATELDKVAQSMAQSQEVEAAELERLVAELMYLNITHIIVRKNK